MAAAKRRASGFVTFVFLAQLLFDGMPLITRSSRILVDGTVSTATCECASCGATICRSACKHDCSQCCRCCIYFEIRVGRRDVNGYLDYPFVGVGRDVERDDDMSAAAELESQLMLRRRRRQVQHGDDENGLGELEEQQTLNSWSLLSNDTMMDRRQNRSQATRRATSEIERENYSYSSSPRRDLSSRPYKKALQTVWSQHQGSNSVNQLNSLSSVPRQRSVDASNVQRSQDRSVNAIESTQFNTDSSPSSPLASPATLHQVLQVGSGHTTHRLPCRIGGVSTAKSLGQSRDSSTYVKSDLCRGTRSLAVHHLGRRQR